MKKKFFSILTMALAICMAISWIVLPIDVKVSMKKMYYFDALAATANSINEIGTFHDNSWDGVSLKEIDSSFSSCSAWAQ